MRAIETRDAGEPLEFFGVFRLASRILRYAMTFHP
jgi:hypothetical protein